MLDGASNVHVPLGRGHLAVTAAGTRKAGAACCGAWRVFIHWPEWRASGRSHAVDHESVAPPRKNVVPPAYVAGMKIQQNPIQHVALVLDASPSMQHLVDTVITVADDQIKFLAQRSQELDLETHVTVYMFADPDMIYCLFYDKDVLRLPSLKGLYKWMGRSTALIDATMRSQLDLQKTATLYGDHAFLTFVLTDGEENSSHVHGSSDLRKLLAEQPDNTTVAIMVPDQRSKIRCHDLGFGRDNVAVWDATSKQGMEEAGRVIRGATDVYMTNLSRGVVNKGVFNMDPATINHKTVAANLKELTGFRVERVKQGQPAVIKEFIESLRPKVPFVQGANYFPLIKRERINDSKEILVRHIMSGKIYGGPQARTLVGLPDTGEVSVSPQPNSEYEIFVQSTSLNRKLIPGHDLLIKV